MMFDNGPVVTVEAIFDDCVAAEIACALLCEGSLRPEEPEPIGLRRWLVQVLDLTPTLARRAQVVLQRARASETRIVGEDADLDTGFLTPAALALSPGFLPQRSLSEA
jgi:hypothetical protein